MIKVKLIQNSVEYRYSHDLKYLIGLLKDFSIDKELSIKLNMLTSYAIDSRYESIDVDRTDALEAFDTAEQIVKLLSIERPQ